VSKPESLSDLKSELKRARNDHWFSRNERFKKDLKVYIRELERRIAAITAGECPICGGKASYASLAAAPGCDADQHRCSDVKLAKIDAEHRKACESS
jgi:hypothetical protein